MWVKSQAFPVVLWLQCETVARTVTEHLPVLIHTHPPNAYKHNIETDCIMLCLRVCEREYSYIHVVFIYKGVIDAARWVQRQQRRNERGRGKEERGCCFALFKALSHIDHSSLVLTWILSISHGLWTKRPNALKLCYRRRGYHQSGSIEKELVASNTTFQWNYFSSYLSN